jgi:superfamily II DNA helicase RecQ
MQYRIFYIPIADSVQAENDMNAFLRGQKVVSVRKDLLQDGGAWVWVFMVEFAVASSVQKTFAGRGELVDYRGLLSPDDFSLFLRLKELRKKLAAEKSVPVFTIFTNEQLAEISRKRPATLTGLKDCDGIGEAKVRDFGDAIIAATKDA